VAEVEEDSPIFRVFQDNSPVSSVVLGSEAERVLKMRLLNLAPMPRRMPQLSRRTAADQVDLSRQASLQSTLRPTRPLTRRRTRQRSRQASLSHPGKAINLRMINLCGSSGIVAEPEDMVTPGAVLGLVGPRSQNRKTMKRTRIRGRTNDSLDTLEAVRTRLRGSLTLSKGLDSEP